MQRADLLRFHRGGDAPVAGLLEQLLEQQDVRLLVVDDQDAAVEDVDRAMHHFPLCAFAPDACAAANSIATSSVSMNSLTLMGLVR